MNKSECITCGWIGTDLEKIDRNDGWMTTLICPKCGEESFYLLHNGEPVKNLDKLIQKYEDALFLDDNSLADKIVSNLNDSENTTTSNNDHSFNGFGGGDFSGGGSSGSYDATADTSSSDSSSSSD